jgi:hypothetical protein
MAEPLDLSKGRVVPFSRIEHKVTVAAFGKRLEAGLSMREWLNRLSGFLAASDLLEVAAAIAAAKREAKPIIWALGAHVIKVGLSPLLVDLMARGFVSHLALNGAGSIHDCEIALFGATSEEVGAGVREGSFGMSKETGEFWNSACREGAGRGLGLGRALGEALLRQEAAHLEVSLLASAARLGLPATVHVTLGADITHMHPGADGAAIGAGSHSDFRLLAGSISRLGAGGVLLNVGSAQLLPMLLEKSVAAARNQGHEVSGFVGVNLDMIQHYRSSLWPVQRAKELGGRGYALTGHHELMLPLLAAAVLEEEAASRQEGKPAGGGEPSEAPRPASG